MTGFILLDVLLFLYAIVLPGYVIVREVLKESDALTCLVLGTTLAVFAIPLLTFGFAMVFRTNMQLWLFLVVATLGWGVPLLMRRLVLKSNGSEP